MVKIQVPPRVGDASSWLIYKKQLQIWQLTSGEDKKIMGAKIAATFTDKDDLKANLAKRFYETVDIEKLHSDGGFDYIIAFLEKELAKSGIHQMVEAWNEFEYFKKTREYKIEEFCEEFEIRYARAENAGCGKISPYVRAFMLLNRSGVTKSDRTAILAQVEGPEKDGEFYDKMVKYVKIQAGAGPQAPVVEGVKTELEEGDAEIFTATIDGKEYTMKRKGKFNIPKGKKSRTGESSKGKGYSKDEKKLNKIGPDGKRNKCFACGAEDHYSNNPGCPKKREKETNMVESSSESESHEEAFFTVLHTEESSEMHLFTFEARGCAALDTCCTSSVAGEKWLENYKQMLPKELRKQIIFKGLTGRRFRFGDSKNLVSLGLYTIPAKIANKTCTITFDLIESDIPLLLSKKAMKKAKVSIDLSQDKVVWKGEQVKVLTTSSGHYCLPLIQRKSETFKVDEILATEIDPTERQKRLVKLHT